MKKSILIMPFLLICFVGFSQWRKVEKLPRDKTPNVKLGYWTTLDFKHPGLVIGGEFMFKRRSVTTWNFERTKENYFAVNFLFFDEPDLVRGIGLTANWLKRTTYQHSGIFTELNFGVGYVREATTRPTTYVRNADGSETTKAFANGYLMLPLAIGIGYDFMPKTNLPIKFYTQIGVAPLTDLKALLLQFAQPKIEIGVVTSLSMFRKKS